MTWESKYFKPKELLSPDGLEQLKKHNWAKVQKFALEALDSWREWFGVGISVNFAMLQRRGYRSEAENRSVGGVANSPHQQGLAFDQTPHNYPLFDYFVLAVYWSYLRQKESVLGFNALGIYPQNNFMHGDFRWNLAPTLVLWNGYSKKVLTKVIEFDKLPLESLDTWLVKELGLPDWKLSRFTMKELLSRTL